MQRLLPSLCLAVLTVLTPAATPALAQSGIVLRTFPLKAGKLLLDPVRPQLYATLPADNSLAVINTDTNTVVTTFFIGSNPVDLAISPDGTRLYVANSGSTAAGVGVVDLTSLTVLPSLPAPFTPTAIAAGLGNRLYLANGAYVTSGTAGVTQIDAGTGAVQNIFGDAIGYQPSALQISPDFKTLYANDDFGLESFDVSTADAASLQDNGPSSDQTDLTISHNGQYLVNPYSAGNSADYGTTLISADDLSGIIGTFSTGAYPGVAIFSADDSKLYQSQNLADVVKVFSATTFTLLDSVALPPDAEGISINVTSLALTTPNGYLYVAAGDGGFGGVPYDLILVSTQIAPFFNGASALSDGFFYLQFPDSNLFGYYNFNFTPYLFHNDLGFEYPIDAADGSGGLYLYDFTSSDFFFTNPALFPYLYDFALNSFLYYYPDTANPGHYTANPRYFYEFASGQIITK